MTSAQERKIRQTGCDVRFDVGVRFAEPTPENAQMDLL
jgi:hypothetical protein